MILSALCHDCGETLILTKFPKPSRLFPQRRRPPPCDWWAESKPKCQTKLLQLFLEEQPTPQACLPASHRHKSPQGLSRFFQGQGKEVALSDHYKLPMANLRVTAMFFFFSVLWSGLFCLIPISFVFLRESQVYRYYQQFIYSFFFVDLAAVSLVPDLNKRTTA